MKLFPAIDLYDGKAVRLYKGNYSEMTVYSENPIEIARDFEDLGAKFIHIVDLEGAKDGTTPNLSIVKQIANETSLFTEIGGGIRSIDTVKKYLDNGIDRVILGTAAVNDEPFLKEAIALYGDRIAVGVDIKDGFVGFVIHIPSMIVSIIGFAFYILIAVIIVKVVIKVIAKLTNKNAVVDKKQQAPSQTVINNAVQPKENEEK